MALKKQALSYGDEASQYDFQTYQQYKKEKRGGLKGAAKGAATGAKAGATVGGIIGTAIPIPGVGTAIGTAAGALTGGYYGGVIGGITGNRKMKKEYLKYAQQQTEEGLRRAYENSPEKIEADRQAAIMAEQRAAELERQKALYAISSTQPMVAGEMPMYKKGGVAKMVMINVEKGELAVDPRTMKVIMDFNDMPKHPKGKDVINQKGNVKVPVGTIIIPADMRKDFLKAEPGQRIEMAAELIERQREGEEKEMEGNEGMEEQVMPQGMGMAQEQMPQGQGMMAMIGEEGGEEMERMQEGGLASAVPFRTNFEKRIMNPFLYIQNPDKTRSTHEMMSFEVDGKYYAAPTIVEKNNKLVRLSPDEARDYALKNKEYKQFKTEKEAQQYAEGGYKKGTPLEKYGNGGYVKKYQNGTPGVDDDEFNKAINWIADYEQEGSSAGKKGYVGGGTNWGTNKSDITSKEKAIEYYRDNYWPMVKDLPPGLRSRALQLAINTGDPYGEMLVASGKMSVQDRIKAVREAEAKGLTGLDKNKYILEKRRSENQADIDNVISQFNQDPKGYLSSLDAEQDRYYNKGLQGVNDEQRNFLSNYYKGIGNISNQYIANYNPSSNLDVNAKPDYTQTMTTMTSLPAQTIATNQDRQLAGGSQTVPTGMIGTFEDYRNPSTQRQAGEDYRNPSTQRQAGSGAGLSGYALAQGIGLLGAAIPQYLAGREQEKEARKALEALQGQPMARYTPTAELQRSKQDVEAARERAKYGFSAAELGAREQQIAQMQRTAYQRARESGLSGTGQAVLGALGSQRLQAANEMAIQDARLQLEKQKYAEMGARSIADAYQRLQDAQTSQDIRYRTMQEQAYGGALRAGLENQYGAFSTAGAGLGYAAGSGLSSLLALL